MQELPTQTERHSAGRPRSNLKTRMPRVLVLSSPQRRCHPEEALYLPTLSHLKIVNELFSLSLSLSLSLSVPLQNWAAVRYIGDQTRMVLGWLNCSANPRPRKGLNSLVPAVEEGGF
jgi:hypothetical protein